MKKTLLIILCLSLTFSQTVFAGGSGIQLNTAINPVAQIAYRGVRSTVVTFGVHAEPQFFEAVKIKDLSVSCYAPKIISRAYLLNDSGKILGSAVFKNDGRNLEGGAMITAKIKPTRLARIVAGDLSTNFKIAISPKQNAPLRNIECGVSHVTFIDTDTRLVVEDGSVLLDSYAYFENFVTQLVSIKEKNIAPAYDNFIIRIQAK